MAKGLFKEKFNLKTYGFLLLAIILAWPIGKVGATLGQQLLEAIYGGTTVSQVSYGDILVDEEKEIENNINKQPQITPQNITNQILNGKWLIYVEANTRILYGYNHKSGEVRVISNSPDDKVGLTAHGDYLVWEEIDDLWVYDFKKDFKEKLHDTPGVPEISPDIYGDKIVYSNVDNDLFLYDITTKETINITKQPVNWRTVPSIWKDIVAWADTSDGVQNVYIYDLKKDIKKKITDYSSDMKMSNVLVTDGWVVHSYFDHNDSTKQFMAYNLKTDKVQKLPHLPGTKTRIKVDKFDGGSLIWKRTDNQQVVIYDLNSNEAEEMGELQNITLFEKTVIGYDDGEKKIKVKKPKKKKDKKIKEEKNTVPEVIYQPG